MATALHAMCAYGIVPDQLHSLNCTNGSLNCTNGSGSALELQDSIRHYCKNELESFLELQNLAGICSGIAKSYLSV